MLALYEYIRMRIDVWLHCLCILVYQLHVLTVTQNLWLFNNAVSMAAI